MKNEAELIAALNAPAAEERLEALRALRELERAGKVTLPEAGRDVNNHVHTVYSFSPYSPTAAVWAARRAGLATVGIMDHDSVAGIKEFHEAGRIAGIRTTGGMELRVSFASTPVAGRRINNPDQDSVVYMAFHGLHEASLEEAAAFMAPYAAARGERNRKMVSRINDIFSPLGIRIDYERDVLPLSRAAEGGSVTERHLMCALARAIVALRGRGEGTVSFLEKDMGIKLSDKLRGFLLDGGNAAYEYDLIGVLKSDVVPKVYVDADAECPDVKEALAAAKRLRAVSAYAYLGDVGSSVTGDKRAQKFEDDYIVDLFDLLKELGFDAVTYMPSRNTVGQLTRVRAMCDERGLMQISGEDINTPRQSFICPAILKYGFENLIESTYALIGHEKLGAEDIEESLFSERLRARIPDLGERVAYFAAAGRK